MARAKKYSSEQNLTTLEFLQREEDDVQAHEAQMSLSERCRELAKAAASADTETYVCLLAEANKIISEEGKKEGYDDNHIRYLLHQANNFLFAQLRAKAKGEEVGFGFFKDNGIAAIDSQFNQYPEGAYEDFSLSKRIDEPVYDSIVIGWGPKEFQINIKAFFDVEESHDNTKSDGMGTYTQWYDAKTRVYYRQSMTGRTWYKLKIKSDMLAEPILFKEEHAPTIFRSLLREYGVYEF